MMHLRLFVAAAAQGCGAWIPLDEEFHANLMRLENCNVDQCRNVVWRCVR